MNERTVLISLCTASVQKSLSSSDLAHLHSFLSLFFSFLVVVFHLLLIFLPLITVPQEGVEAPPSAESSLLLLLRLAPGVYLEDPERLVLEHLREEVGVLLGAVPGRDGRKGVQMANY